MEFILWPLYLNFWPCLMRSSTFGTIDMTGNEEKQNPLQETNELIILQIRFLKNDEILLIFAPKSFKWFSSTGNNVSGFCGLLFISSLPSAFRCSSAWSGGGTASAGIITDRKRPAQRRRTLPMGRGEEQSSTCSPKKKMWSSSSCPHIHIYTLLSVKFCTKTSSWLSHIFTGRL